MEEGERMEEVRRKRGEERWWGEGRKDKGEVLMTQILVAFQETRPAFWTEPQEAKLKPGRREQPDSRTVRWHKREKSFWGEGPGSQEGEQ